MEISWISGSPFAWRALLALEIKKAPYVSRLLEFSKGQTQTSEFLALNPRGKVPTLKDGDFVLAESLAILAYLDRRFPEPPLFGRTAEETGRIWKSISECFSYIEPAVQKMVAPIFFGGAAEKAGEIREAAKTLHAEFQAAERALRATPWLAGEAISAADIALYPFVEVLLRAAGKEAAQPLDLGFQSFARVYPAIAAWMARIKSLTGYDKTYPLHWRAADAKSTRAA